MWSLNDSITGSKDITSEQTEKIHKGHQVAVTQWRKRKRLVSTILVT